MDLLNNYVNSLRFEEIKKYYVERTLKRNNDFEINESNLIDKIRNENQSNEKLIIISDEPGMGKSLITKSIAYNLMINQSNKQNNVNSNSNSNEMINNFVIYLSLNNFSEEFEELKKKSIEKLDSLEIICKIFLKNNDSEYALFKQLANSNGLIVIFDGLDEVIQFKNEIYQMIRNLLEKFKLKKIILTARNHLKNELQETFGIISYNLTGFTQQNQIEFLTNFWLNNYDQNSKIESQALKDFANRLISKLDKNLISNSNIVEIPLKLRMIAEIYKKKIYPITIKERIESAKLFNEFNNLSDFYNSFIEAKFEEISNLKDNKNTESIKETKEKFLMNHFNYSFLLLFNEPI